MAPFTLPRVRQHTGTASSPQDVARLTGAAYAFCVSNVLLSINRWVCTSVLLKLTLVTPICVKFFFLHLTHQNQTQNQNTRSSVEKTQDTEKIGGMCETHI